MTCGQFKKYELGELGEKKFRRHLKRCAFCQEEMKVDGRLMSLAGSLKLEVRAPFLWKKIEESLEREKPAKMISSIEAGRRRRAWLIPAAVLLLLTVSIGLYLFFRPESGESRLLSRSALKKVEEKERGYIKAIEKLEKSAFSEMAKMDVELMMLYRVRLETIDDQIERCKEALSENPANAHIRRYMLAALQDKKETLAELLGFQQEQRK